MIRKYLRLLLSVSGFALCLFVLKMPVSGGFRVGEMLDPLDGLYRTARNADTVTSAELTIPDLSAPVRIVRDDRGVPHIFADNDRDAVIAFGFVLAQDRLFQLDFVPRAASGRLSEVMGESALDTDRFFRRIGMPWAAEKNAAWLEKAGSVQLDLIQWYQAGANAYIRSLEPKDDPFEFRILGYRPSELTTVDALLVLQYMVYDLTYRGRDGAYTALRNEMDGEEYERLFPEFSKYFVPIIPAEEEHWGADMNQAGSDPTVPAVTDDWPDLAGDVGTLTEGYRPGIGSNNWAVDGSRSTTGFPILSGDMHLSLSLPAIWYEAHLVTPTMNVYGVTIPGAPVIVEGITPSTAWAYTNTGSDQIDFYSLDVDSEKQSYTVDGIAERLDRVSDTIHVARGDDVIEPLYYSRYGPVVFEDESATAIRWVAHDTTRTLEAIWRMGHASNYAEFEKAIRYWDTPMQNILFADREGTIAIRSTGYLPLRGSANGVGLLNGRDSANDWVGRVPFDQLPHSIRPGRGYLTSTNQQPTAKGYPYYLGHDWRDAYRSIRIDDLLSRSPEHSVDDIRSYQSDVHAVQADLYIPLLDSLEGLTEEAGEVRDILVAWDRNTRVEQPEPVLFDAFFTTLKDLVWDEDIFQETVKPADTRLLTLILEDQESRWFDRVSTPEVEVGTDLLRVALQETASRFGDDLQSLRWGDHHQVMIRHLTRSTALGALWRGPYPYPGYRQTLSPGDALMTTFSASWRVAVDFSTTPPTAYGVYPGGQSGNPFSHLYDLHIQTFLNFDHYRLHLPSQPNQLSGAQVREAFDLLPTG